MKRFLLILLIVFLAGCSDSISYKEDHGRCIERDEHHLFGITWLTNEYGDDHPCSEMRK